MKAPLMSEGAEPVGARSRTSVWHWLTLGGGALLFIWLLLRIDWADVGRMLRTASLSFMFAALGLRFLTTMMRAVRFDHFFRRSRHPWFAFGVFCMLRLLNYTMPFRTGEVASLGVLKKAGLSPAIMESASVWLVIKAIDVLTACCLIVPLVLPVAGTHLVTDLPLARWSVGMSVVGILAFFALVYGLKWLQRHAVSLPEGRGWRGHLRRFVEGVRHLSFGGLLMALFMGLLIAVVNILTCTVILLGFDPGLPLLTALLAPGVALLLNLAPVTPPLGIGATDAIWVGSLMMLGVSAEAALPLTVGMRLHQMVSVAIEGSIGLVAMNWQRRHGELA